MKKIFTFFMAMVVTLAMYAVTPIQSGNKVDPTGRATELADKKLKHNKQVAKVLGMDQMERQAKPATMAAPVAKAQHEELMLNYDAFAGMRYYEEEGQWWIGLSCDDWSRTEYGHNLNLEWNAPADNPCGTFTTEDVNPALKDWMGTWKVTSADTYVQPKDGDEGLTGEPSERIITIGTDSVFELELGEADLIVAGLSYTDGIPLFNGGLQLETIGRVNGNGQLELVNGVETFYAEGVGTFTWVGYCEIPAMQTYSIVTGAYAPYTLAFGANKNVGTGTRYEGKISSGEPFYVHFTRSRRMEQLLQH